MKKLAFLLVVSIISISAFAQTKSFLDVPYLETSARVDTLVTPDKIYLSITITEKDSKGRKSVEEQENKMAQAFRSLGINLDKQLFIKDLSSNFKKYFLRQKDVLKSKSFSLLVYSGKQAGDALAALERLKIANTYLEKTEYSKMDALELELKSKAVKKAKKKADALTAPLNQKVGNAIHIVDSSQPYYPRTYARQKINVYAEAAVAQSPEPLDVDFEQIKVETSVNVKFALSN
ncbi:SIMPL domain-containing protein [Flagellimonas sp. S174]|uniref:SIMPL domain-containing protein n=1 Tax=Flagellimonas sp. S174 TaxID=3410790 RepID=UPI00261B52ED|nr:SIMPL domain-containing protein [uncultured Allomuricauda sp.]